jgi:phosphatidylserine/phosphatidylglycerophosphate/cardiolipin synthase-like enzyme
MPLRDHHIPSVGSGSYPVRGGCAVRPLVDGEPAFREICQAIESAKRRVWGTVAFLEEDVQLPDGRGTIFDVLDTAADRA